MKTKIMRKGLIKTVIVFFSMLIGATQLIAQSEVFNLNESICYCSGGSPQSILKMDNNWELALLLRKQMSKTQMDSVGVNYTNSQLKLLESWNIITYNKNKTYQTLISILDSMKTVELRRKSKQISIKLTEIIEPKVVEMKNHLEKQGRGKNTYSILFSYVIDGMIWDSFEEKGLINNKELSIDNPFWSGEFWALYPKRSFYSGTNSISDKGFSLKVNWSEKAIQKMLPFVTRFDLQSKILDEFISANKITNQEVLDVFSKFDLFDEKGNITVPVITENNENKVFMLSKDIVSLIVNFIEAEIDIETLMPEFLSNDRSRALIILYHEMIWDIMDILEEKNIVEKPIIFKNPEKAQSKDISSNVFFTISKPNY